MRPPLPNLVAWLLFAVGAAIPAALIVVVAVRTAKSEEVRVRADRRDERATAATNLRRDVELAILQGHELLRGLPADASPEAAEEKLATQMQAFAEPFVLRPDGELILPHAGGPLDAPASGGLASRRAVIAALLYDPVAKRHAYNIPAPSEVSKLVLRATPLDTVFFLDGVRQEGNPLVTTIPLDHVTHSVRAESPGFVSKWESVTADASNISMSFSLKQGPTETSTLDASRVQLAKANLAFAPFADSVHLLRQGGTVISVRRLASGIDIGWILDEVSVTRGASSVLPSHLRLERKDDLEAVSSYLAVSNPPSFLTRVVVPSSSTAIGSILPPQKVGDGMADIVFGPRLAFRVSPKDAPMEEQNTVAKGHRVLRLSIIGVVVLVAFAAFLFARARRAQRLADLRTDFVAAVSHELRTPLASVRMLAELLEAGAVPTNERAEVEHTLAGETRRLTATLERMLRFGALSRGKLVVDRQPTPLAPVLEGAVQRLTAAHPGQDVFVDVEPSLEANIDGGLVGLALDNLLANAVKYAPDSGPLTLRARPDGADVLVDVIDRGVGLDRRAQRRVFLPFERADDRLSKATEGTGVGLALVRGIARAHGGEASVRSEIGNGATFTLRLPRA